MNLLLVGAVIGTVACSPSTEGDPRLNAHETPFVLAGVTGIEQLCQPLAALDHVGRLEACPGRDAGRCGVVGMDVARDQSDAAVKEPADELAGRLRRVATTLSRQADHPGDVGHPSGVVDCRLDEPRRRTARSLPDDPVV